MTIRPIIVAAIGSALLLGIILPMASAQAPPCFTFDGKIQTMQCPVSFRPAPVAYYSGVQQGEFVQATDEDLPSGFFDQETINTLRQNAAQNQSQNGTQQQQPEPEPEPQPTSGPEPGQFQAPTATSTNATNLTSTDIESVRDGLNAARQGLQNNDTQAAIESINRADGGVFAILTDEARGPVRDELTTLSDDINTTRESVRNLDNEKALQDLNAADSQLLLITEMLPTATTTTTTTEDPQPSTNETLILPEEATFAEEQQLQFPANETLPPIPEPEPSPAIQPQAEPEPVQEPTINIKIPLNQTQQELITVEEVAGLNKTTHEKSTITIVEGNKTTHREITTTEVSL